MKTRNNLLVVGILLFFALLTAVRHLGSLGSDLSSSYCACRLLSSHQADHLYSRDPVNYDVVTDPVWTRLGLEADLYHEKQIHPYVQTPLWAFGLQPLCTRMKFSAFNIIFLFFTSFALSATLWLIARTWTPRLLHPGWMALVCAGLYLTEAYKYAMVLTQTHILFTLLTLAALLCVRRGNPVWAGALLALAASVKITPGFLLLYWLASRQWRASLSFVGFSAALAGASVLTTGLSLNLLYLHNLSEISNILLVAWNNQSLAGWWMGSHYPASEQQAWHSLHLPVALKLLSTLLCAGASLLGGYLDRRAEGRPAVLRATRLPYGAALAIVGATVFTPIAWTHYYVILVFPFMLLLEAELETKSRLLLAVLVLVFILNFDYQTGGHVLQRYELFPIVHAQFYSGLVCLLGLLAASTGIGLGAQSPSARAGANVRTVEAVR